MYDSACTLTSMTVDSATTTYGYDASQGMTRYWSCPVLPNREPEGASMYQGSYTRFAVYKNYVVESSQLEDTGRIL